MNPVDVSLSIRLREALAEEWRQYGFFPCYAAVLPLGDPDFHWRDVRNFIQSRSDPFLQAATLLFWGARVLRVFSKQPKGGLSRRVPLQGRGVLRFHTFFTDSYFYSAIRSLLQSADLSEEERRFWEGVAVSLVETALRNREFRVLSGETFAVFPFFPRKELASSADEKTRRFLRWSGLGKIDPDADDTFVLLEMFADFCAWLCEEEGLPWLEDERRMTLRGSIARLLATPYWKLARAYQFRADGIRAPAVNYTDVSPLGGVSAWFGIRPDDAPDLTVNANVLRSLLVNRKRWNLLQIAAGKETAQGIIAFLERNTSSGLFRHPRGHSFYLPEFYVAMFARLWTVWESLPEAERAALDPEKRMERLRLAALDYLGNELHPQRNLNPLDAALALEAARSLRAKSATWISGWQRILEAQAAPEGIPYPAYEIFKGKIPTHMVYGSPATTAALTLTALQGYRPPAAGTTVQPAPPGD